MYFRGSSRQFAVLLEVVELLNLQHRLRAVQRIILVGEYLLQCFLLTDEVPVSLFLTELPDLPIDFVPVQQVEILLWDCPSSFSSNSLADSSRDDNIPTWGMMSISGVISPVPSSSRLTSSTYSDSTCGRTTSNPDFGSGLESVSQSPPHHADPCRFLHQRGSPELRHVVGTNAENVQPLQKRKVRRRVDFKFRRPLECSVFPQKSNSSPEQLDDLGPLSTPEVHQAHCGNTPGVPPLDEFARPHEGR